MRYVYLIAGEISQIVNSPNTKYYDGILSDDIVKCELDVTDEELIMGYFYSNGEFIPRPPRPSDYHTWLKGEWVFNMINLQNFKSSQITKQCASHILDGFVSGATGVNYRYPSNDRDQVNLSGTIQKSLLPGAQSSDYYPFLCADANGVWDYRLHTAAQIQQVGVDAYNAILNYRIKNATLQAQIAQATTKAELDLIVW